MLLSSTCFQSCTHTGNDVNPWWAVDLGESYNVIAVNITNRLYQCKHLIVVSLSSLLCAYVALNRPQEDFKSSSDNFSLLSFQQCQAPFWGYTCAVMAANVGHTNLPDFLVYHFKTYGLIYTIFQKHITQFGGQRISSQF